MAGNTGGTIPVMGVVDAGVDECGCVDVDVKVVVGEDVNVLVGEEAEKVVHYIVKESNLGYLSTGDQETRSGNVERGKRI